MSRDPWTQLRVKYMDNTAWLNVTSLRCFVTYTVGLRVCVCVCRLHIFMLWSCCSVSSGTSLESVQPLTSFTSHVIVGARHVCWGYIQLLCNAQHVQTCTFCFFLFFRQLFQPGSGICPATAVQKKMFQTTDAALTWNVRQQQNNLRFCMDRPVMYLQNLTAYR